MKRLVSAGVLTLAVGGVLMTGGPAMASDDPRNVQIIGGQTCRSIEVAGIGAAVHNVLGITHEEGGCANGSAIGG
ncbi:hypothetical protein [Spirillospora sp. NPDC047279]|uniref:hypothetical protein n=1 Tax=Spirillospora sp. NPDC047279 TaxID=3155478 RepID=UPI003411EC50